MTRQFVSQLSLAMMEHLDATTNGSNVSFVQRGEIPNGMNCVRYEISGMMDVGPTVGSVSYVTLKLHNVPGGTDFSMTLEDLQALRFIRNWMNDHQRIIVDVINLLNILSLER